MTAKTRPKGFGVSLAVTVYGPGEYCHKHRRLIRDRYIGCHECLTDFFTRRTYTPILLVNPETYASLKNVLG